MCHCTVDRPESRSTFLLALAAAVGIAIAGLSWVAGSGASPRPLAWVPNPAAAGAREVVVEGVRRVISAESPARLLPDTSLPREDVRLLWLSGRLAQPASRGSVVLDDSGGIVEVDTRLRVRRRDAMIDGRELTSVAASAGRGLWVTTLDGAVLRLADSGSIDRQLEATPFRYASVFGSPSGGNVWIARSNARFDYHLDSTAPLLARLDAGPGAASIGAARIPDHSLLIDLANAGTVAVREDRVYFAPFIRDEIVALEPNGDTVWVASRDLPQTTHDPRFEIDGGKVVVNYHPVNLGVSLGPDGKVYVLSTPGFTTTRSRLDVFDPASGVLLRSASLSTALPTIAVSASGRVFHVAAERILEGLPGRKAEEVAPLSLPVLSGGSMPLFEPNRITLVNVWASWCVPCREEMPALDSLQRVLGAEARFRFVTVNEDVRVESARQFLAEFGFEFPVLLGMGDARSRLHYPGLPYSLLLDGRGRVTGKWIGYSGAGQVAGIRAAIERELARGTGRSHVHH